MRIEICKEEARGIKPVVVTKIEKGCNTGLRVTEKDFFEAIDKSYKIVKTEKNIMDQIDTYDLYCEDGEEEYIMSAIVAVMR